MIRAPFFAVVLGAALLLAGCTSLVSAVRDEPVQPDPYETPIGTDINDFQMATAIGVNIRKEHPLLAKAHVNVHVYNGVVLLTGEVPSQEMRHLAGEVARRYPGVRQVHNELAIQGVSSLLSRTNDRWLTAKVRARLIADDQVDADKIKVVAENGVIYLMGLVTPQLADRAAQVASTTRGVRKVVRVFEYPETP
ncbi:MAG: BON domain-containing protein [Porticoccaceae bacterium]|nr:MAG: BON domain-containing protein [Porticoccaceae bacterium]